ncbi:rab-like protein 6 isoform X2 [Bombyx mandarina]|uniref:Rab-like protein 6 isoform X2 n=1 Tax=Bombyx mandarina TaxID=7092 RepID=A0A6J2K9Z4_BOMMA|nr:rab-like protein 6 isoform X2 [Bombyx mandarina]
MFSALKKLARSSDDRCPPPMPMSSSLQKKFSRGVHFNMKILIKGDRNVGKSCLLQRLQGGPFIEDYVPTDQIQVAPIHWTYKNSDYIVKVEVWEVVDKGRTKKKTPIGLKLENQSAPSLEDNLDAPVLDATFLDVYKNTTGVILMLDITKPWTFEYVVKELSQVPADLPVVILGNHCDMQHHRQVHSHHIEQALHNAKQIRTAPVRYAESSMRNGFGLRLLHKFLSIPFLRLQKTSLLEQLQRNQRDMEEIEQELDEYQNSEESQYNTFLDRLTNKRKQNTNQVEPRPSNERSPSIVLGGGKPIVPPSVNPLLAQSLNPSMKAQIPEAKQTQFVHPDLIKPKQTVNMDTTPPRLLQHDSNQSTPSVTNAGSSVGTLDEFYAGALDSSFLEDLTPLSSSRQEIQFESESDDDTTNPKVTVDEDDLDIDTFSTELTQKTKLQQKDQLVETDLHKTIERNTSQKRESETEFEKTDNDFPLWSGDSSVRRSPEGGEDPDALKDPGDKSEKKHHKKKKSKDKDRGDYSEISERKEKKQKRKKSKSEKKPNPQQDLLAPSGSVDFDYAEYDSI